MTLLGIINNNKQLLIIYFRDNLTIWKEEVIIVIVMIKVMTITK